MSNKPSILLVEDEDNISHFITATLQANDYSVLSARDGRQALALASSHCPDLMLLDLGLPDLDGLEIIREVRAWSQLPIVVVSARDHERDKVQALDLGADDYVTKPFGTSELLARIRTAMRHAQARSSLPGGAAGVYTIGALTVDLDRRRVLLAGQDVHLTQNEYKLVALLCRNAGRVLTYDFMIQSIWGPYAKGDNQILRVNMANIRRKIEKNPAEPAYILTEVGVGYRMVESVEAAQTDPRA